MSNTMSNQKCRKWQITINNPIEHSFSHEKIRETNQDLKGLVYWCMCDEIGQNETYHTHIYMYYKDARTFETIKNLFPPAHIERARGTSQENRDYIRKEGKHSETEKATTNLKDTFEEFGQIPEEHQGKRTDYSRAVEMLYDEYSINDIIREFPHFIGLRKHFQEYKNSLIYDKYKNIIREITVIYQWGATGTGKTRSIFDKFGYEDVYSISDYSHPFDDYEGQPIIVFEEFRGQIDISSMLKYLDRYPCILPARYFNKTACYSRVYINSNIPIEKQYINEQRTEPETFKAFKRRIQEEIEFTSEGERIHKSALPSEHEIATTKET